MSTQLKRPIRQPDLWVSQSSHYSFKWIFQCICLPLVQIISADNRDATFQHQKDKKHSLEQPLKRLSALLVNMPLKNESRNFNNYSSSRHHHHRQHKQSLTRATNDIMAFHALSHCPITSFHSFDLFISKRIVRWTYFTHKQKQRRYYSLRTDDTPTAAAPPLLRPAWWQNRGTSHHRHINIHQRTLSVLSILARSGSEVCGSSQGLNEFSASPATHNDGLIPY